MPRRAFISAPPTPISLLVRLHDGTDAEWRRFVELYGPFVYRLAVAGGLATHDAEDVAAVVMDRLVRRLRGGLQREPAKGKFRAYVVTATAREARRLRKAAPGYRLEGLAETEPSPQEQLARIEKLERLRLCLQRLREAGDVRRRDLRAFEDYVLKEMPVRKVARRSRVTVARVYGIKHEMLARIRVMMKEMDAEMGEV